MLGFEGFAGLAMRVQGRAWKQEWMWGFLDFGLGVGAKWFKDQRLRRFRGLGILSLVLGLCFRSPRLGRFIKAEGLM